MPPAPHPRTQTYMYTASELVSLKHGTIRLVQPHTLLSTARARDLGPAVSAPTAGSSTFCLIWHELTPPFSSRPALSLFSLLHLQSQQTSNGPASTSCHRMKHLLLSSSSAVLRATPPPTLPRVRALASPLCWFLTLGQHFPFS